MPLQYYFMILDLLESFKGVLHFMKKNWLTYVWELYNMCMFIGTKELTRKYEVSKSQFSDNDTYSQVCV